jgi:hypothetical protein
MEQIRHVRQEGPSQRMSMILRFPPRRDRPPRLSEEEEEEEEVREIIAAIHQSKVMAAYTAWKLRQYQKGDRAGGRWTQDRAVGSGVVTN